MKNRFPALSAALSVFIFGGFLLLAGCSTPLSMSPAFDAIHNNDVDKLRKELDSGVSPDHIESEDHNGYVGFSLLGASLADGHTDMAELLLQRGADPRKAFSEKFISYMKFMPSERKFSIAKLLLSNGVDPNQQLGNDLGYPVTLLYLTCNSPRATELLLAKGAKADGLETNLDTPLTRCLTEFESYKDSIKSVQSSPWFDHPYSGSGRDMHNAFDIYVKDRDQTLESSLILLKFGADPSAKVWKGSVKTPLFMSAYVSKEPRIFQALLDRGADVMARQEPSGTTALHILSQFRDSNTARDLIKRARIAASNRARSPEEANALFFSWLNQPFDAGYTALHIAAMYGATNVIPVLIEAGADYSLKDNAGYTAQYYLDKKIAEVGATAVAAQEAQRRQYEQAEEDAHQSAVNRQGLMAIAGAVAIGSATSGRNFSNAQRSDLVDAYVKDRVNAANGTESNNFAQAAGTVKGQLDMASMAAAAQSKTRADSQRAADAQRAATKRRADEVGQQARTENARSNSGAPASSGTGGASGATNVANTEKAKTYLCPQRESFTSSIHYLNAKVETFTFEEACARAQQQASEFVGRLGRNQTGYGNNMKVKNIEACRKTNHDEEAVVHVNMEEPSSSACGTTSGGMAR